MANANQGLRSGNAFGRVTNTDLGETDKESVVLKPGYLIRLRDRYHLVTAVEAVTTDLWFTDTLNVGITAVSSSIATDFDGTHGEALERYGLASISAYYDLGTGTVAAADKTGNILAPDYDSGYLTYNDLEPYKGNLYQLCPTMPLQPKFMDTGSGDWHSANAYTPYDTSNGGLPIGFGGGTDITQVGTTSAKLYIKHPAGVPKHVLDEAPEGSSGTVRSEAAIEGISGFIDGSISSAESPDWSYSLWIEHGENNLPALRVVNDSDEFLVDGRIRLCGWKYRIVELTNEQLATFKAKSGGRLRFMIINSTGLPVAGSFLADYFPN